MAANSSIEWTDHTFNPWRGCTKVHEGCANCYAERDAKRFPANRGIWGPNGTRVIASEAMWKQPVKWNRQALAEGVRKKVFCASLADVFEDWEKSMVDHNGDVPLTCEICGTIQKEEYLEDYQKGAMCVNCKERMKIRMEFTTMNDVRMRLFELIDQTPWLDWILVTKRPENIRRMWPDKHCDNCLEVSCGPHRTGCLDMRFRENVRLLTSVSNQQTLEEMAKHLVKCRDLSPVLGISAEPLLGPLNLDAYLKFQGPDWHYDEDGNGWPALNWVIAGGESGPKARSCHPDWIRSLRDQCQAASVPLFFKQWGEYVDYNQAPENTAVKIDQSFNMAAFGHGDELWKVGKKAAGAMLDGREWREFPRTATGG